MFSKLMRKSSGLLTECHAQDPIEGRVLRPRDHRLELECPLVSLAHRALQRRHTHSPIAKRLSVSTYLLPTHVKRMDRIGLTPNFERHVDLSTAINNPDIPVEGRDVDQLGTLDARVDCIHDRPVACRTLGLGDTEMK
jgi:hypothetical protein